MKLLILLSLATLLASRVTTAPLDLREQPPHLVIGTTYIPGVEDSDTTELSNSTFHPFDISPFDTSHPERYSPLGTAPLDGQTSMSLGLEEYSTTTQVEKTKSLSTSSSIADKDPRTFTFSTDDDMVRTTTFTLSDSFSSTMTATRTVTVQVETIYLDSDPQLATVDTATPKATFTVATSEASSTTLTSPGIKASDSPLESEYGTNHWHRVSLSPDSSLSLMNQENTPSTLATLEDFYSEDNVPPAESDSNPADVTTTTVTVYTTLTEGTTLPLSTQSTVFSGNAKEQRIWATFEDDDD